jgi:hypothetical protein
MRTTYFLLSLSRLQLRRNRAAFAATMWEGVLIFQDPAQCSGNAALAPGTWIKIYWI